jgi:hypothetical protein
MSADQPDAPNAYDVVIASLEGERQRLTDMIHALRRIKNLGIPFEATKALMSNEPNNPAYMAQNIPHDAFFGMTIPDAARKYLTWGGSRKTKSNAELCDGLRAGGFQTSAVNFSESVRSTLSRNNDFVKIQGQWGMREWYGDRGTRKPRRITSVNIQAENENVEHDSGDVSVEEAKDIKG